MVRLPLSDQVEPVMGYNPEIVGEGFHNRLPFLGQVLVAEDEMRPGDLAEPCKETVVRHMAVHDAPQSLAWIRVGCAGQGLQPRTRLGTSLFAFHRRELQRFEVQRPEQFQPPPVFGLTAGLSARTSQPCVGRRWKLG